MTMNRKITRFFGILLVGMGFAFAHAADPRNGQGLHDKQCVSCHIQQFGGDGSRVYTRENRRVKDYRGLVQRIAACNAQTGAKWFPEEEADVAAYLNQRFYKFKP